MPRYIRDHYVAWPQWLPARGGALVGERQCIVWLAGQLGHTCVVDERRWSMAMCAVDDRWDQSGHVVMVAGQCHDVP